MFAHVSNGTIDEVGTPPPYYHDTRWWDLRTGDLSVLAQAGWYPVVQAQRPVESSTTTWDPVFTFDGVSSVQQTWVSRLKTPDELNAETASINKQALLDKMRSVLGANANAITQLDTFSAGTAALTNTQRDEALRDLANRQARAFRQLNALIRLQLNDLLDQSGT